MTDRYVVRRADVREQDRLETGAQGSLGPKRLARLIRFQHQR